MSPCSSDLIHRINVGTKFKSEFSDRFSNTVLGATIENHDRLVLGEIFKIVELSDGLACVFS